VSEKMIMNTVNAGCRTVAGVMDRTRAGKGCGSCKLLVGQVVEHACGGGRGRPLGALLRSGHSLDKPTLMATIGDRGLRSVSAVFAILAPASAEDAKSKMGLNSLLKMMWADETVDEQDAKFVNDRLHANIQKDGFSVVPQMRGVA
jgi:nitrite reductase (NADH) large subunit